jgi:hypothetical protein
MLLSERCCPLGMLRGRLLLLLLFCCAPSEFDARHRLTECVLSAASESPRREKRSSDALAMVVETRTSSEVALCTGFRSRLVTSTLMMGACGQRGFRHTHGHCQKRGSRANSQRS